MLIVAWRRVGRLDVGTYRCDTAIVTVDVRIHTTRRLVAFAVSRDPTKLGAQYTSPAPQRDHRDDAEQDQLRLMSGSACRPLHHWSAVGIVCSACADFGIIVSGSGHTNAQRPHAPETRTGEEPLSTVDKRRFYV